MPARAAAEQDEPLQRDTLTAVGCTELWVDLASGSRKHRPKLAAVLEAELERRSRPVVQMVAVPVIPTEVVVQVQAALDKLGQAYTTWAERLDDVGSLNSEASRAGPSTAAGAS